MNKEELGYFHTDWAAMTVTDWVGLIVTVMVFIAMVAAYVLVFLPGNKKKLEDQRNSIDEADKLDG